MKIFKTREVNKKHDVNKKPNIKPSHRETSILKKDSEEHVVDPTRYGDWEVNGRCTDF